MSGGRPVLVVGGGIAGVTSAIEAAEAGAEVVLVERQPSVGGWVLRHHQYFPKMCPPSCGMEINVRRLERNPRVRVLTGTRVVAATRSGGAWVVRLRREPEHVSSRCTLCGECARVCPAQIDDPFQLALGKTTAVRQPHPEAWPRRFALDRGACRPGCSKCAEVCKPGAIDLAAVSTEEVVEAGSIVLATGWSPYPLARLPELGGGALADVVANVQMERLSALNGPTGGRIVRPSDGKPPRDVAFVQCAGSRDVHHLPYCSAVCCLASMKQALYVRGQLPDAAVTIYYIDRRAPGRAEDVLRKAEAAGVRLVKGKVAAVERRADGRLVLAVEDVDAGRRLQAEADLVVLATGMMPSARSAELPFPVQQDGDGFLVDDPQARLFVAGVARRPEDVAASVRHATGAAARAMAAARSS